MRTLVDVKVNGMETSVPEGTSILDAADQVGVKVPALCKHADTPAWGACGICIVRVDGAAKMPRACATAVTPGASYITHDPELADIRRTTLEMILSSHPNECLTCGRNRTCELQTMAANFGIREVRFERHGEDLPKDTSTPSLVLDPEKCIKCGRCVLVCQKLQDVWAIEFLGRGHGTRIAPAADVSLADSPCIKCGQCSAHCPVGAIFERDNTRELLGAIRNEKLHVTTQIAPAVRVALGEAFGLPPGTLSTGKVYAALRRLGVDTVFDTNFSADVTIMEEAKEFVDRLEHEPERLPLITSCCPSWVDYLEKYWDDMIPLFSTAKSPMMMQGALTKTFFAEQHGIDPDSIYSTAIMPCTSKKFELSRSESMYASGRQDVDLVLTTRELARLLHSNGIEFASLPDEEADDPIGTYSGAGTIFGVTGGVMEAALRTAAHYVTGKVIEPLTFTKVRGMDGVRVASFDLKGAQLRVAIAHGMANVRDILKEVRAAKERGEKLPFHFLEVMACRGGCISGGGQPYGSDDKVRAQRIRGLYSDDDAAAARCSYQNPAIQALYREFIGDPGSDRAHELLHTGYRSRPIYAR